MGFVRCLDTTALASSACCDSLASVGSGSPLAAFKNLGRGVF
jgi:hypothetical protein